jgi:hypothetical protein
MNPSHHHCILSFIIDLSHISIATAPVAQRLQSSVTEPVNYF